MPWDNKVNGAHGTATPLGAVKENKCRDFRIGVVDKRGEHWIQGEACSDANGTLLTQVRPAGPGLSASLTLTPSVRFWRCWRKPR